MTKNNLPIKGIGIDLIEIERIKHSILRYGDRFLTRLFTDQEIARCPHPTRQFYHFAGRFAAKESISKALGCGIGIKLSWKDFEILNNEEGKPIVVLTPQTSERFGYPNLLVSISHCRSYANAVAIWI